MTNFKLILKLCKTNLFITDTQFAEMHNEILYDCIHDKKLCNCKKIKLLRKMHKNMKLKIYTNLSLHS